MNSQSNISTQVQHKWLTVVNLLKAPSIILLLVWMIVPLSMTVYYSFVEYNLLYPGPKLFIGLENYSYFSTDSAFFSCLIQYLSSSWLCTDHYRCTGPRSCFVS